METPEITGHSKQVGRYTIFHEIAAGGMATVHLARFAGPAGFSRVVAIKHLHPHLSLDPEFKSMIIDEARLASRIRHPNVVPTLDVVVSKSELFLVMEYVQGESLSSLRRVAKQLGQEIPLPICSAILVGALQGLHAAHEARSESGELLNIVHCDVSPPNLLIGVDGVPMVLDFGIAKAMQARQDTRPKMLKGKSSYMAPEQIRGEPLTRAVDIFAAAVVLWEVLTTRRLFTGATEHERMYKVLDGTDLTPPSAVSPRISVGVDGVVMKGLSANPTDRYRTALEMAEAVERAIPPASQRLVGEWVARTATEGLGRRAAFVKQVEISGITFSTVDADASEITTEEPSRSTHPGSATGATPARPRWRDWPTVVSSGVALVALLALLVTVTRRADPTPTPTGGAEVALPRAAKASFNKTAAIHGRTTNIEPLRHAPSLAPQARLRPGSDFPATGTIAKDQEPVVPPRVATPVKHAAGNPRPTASERSVSRRTAANLAHPRSVSSPAVASPSVAPGGGDRSVERSRSAGTAPRNLKKRVPLVEDQPRIRILED